MEKELLIDLVNRAKAGDGQAMECLLREAHTSVSYQCRKMLKNEQDAEDLTQEVLVTIYRKLEFLQEPAAFHSWVSRITASRCINAMNRSHVEFQFAEDEDGHSAMDNLEDLDQQVMPDRVIDNAETTRMIEEIVDSLPDAQRAVTLMFYYNEMPVRAIARTMQVSENTVKSRLNYARKAIKEKVLGYEKQGVKLYGLSPLPFLLYFLRKAAELQKNEAAAGAAAAGIVAGEGLAAGAGTAAAGTAAAGTAASGAAGTAAAGAAAGIFTGITAKLTAAIVACAVATGGIVTSVLVTEKRADDARAAAREEALSAIVEENGTEAAEEEELSVTEEVTEELNSEETEEIPEENADVTEEIPEDTEETPTEEELPEVPEEQPEEETAEDTETGESGNTGDTAAVPENLCTACRNGVVEAVVLTQATCQTSGEVVFRCNACGSVSGYSYPPGGHVYGLTEDGMYEICTVCDTILGPTYIGHGGVLEDDTSSGGN